MICLSTNTVSNDIQSISPHFTCHRNEHSWAFYALSFQKIDIGSFWANCHQLHNINVSAVVYIYLLLQLLFITFLGVVAAAPDTANLEILLPQSLYPKGIQRRQSHSQAPRPEHNVYGHNHKDGYRMEIFDRPLPGDSGGLACCEYKSMSCIINMHFAVI